jgi:hypothetical protein
MRTVFDLLDSVCDGCPVWGPKAAASGAAKGIKALQVRTDIPREPGEHRGSRGGGAEDSRLTSTVDVDPALLCIS